METAKCSKCNVTKSIDQFSFKNKKDGIRKNVCKVCTKAESAAYYTKNKDKICASTKKYRQSNLELYKNATRKWRSNHPEYAETAKKKLYAWRLLNHDRQLAIYRKYYYANQAVIHEKKTEYYANNKVRIAGYMREYRTLNKDKRKAWNHNRSKRIQTSGGKLSSGIVSRLLRLQRMKCPCCHKPLGSNYHLDHIVPIALGGPNTDDNVQLLRAECNMRKKAKHPVTYMQEQGFLL